MLPADSSSLFLAAEADRILVNSEFTRDVFRRTFARIDAIPTVLYPCVDPSQYHYDMNTAHASSTSGNTGNRRMFLSLNRFERKKNIGLAIRAFASVLQQQPSANVVLCIAGGYDPRLAENVEHLLELEALATSLGVAEHVRFVRSPPDDHRNQLLHECFALLYTPSNEHFGIVPLEAALASKVVLACDSGGPLETIHDGVTGYLRPPEPERWAQVLLHLLAHPQDATHLGHAAYRRVLDKFSVQRFQDTLESILRDMVSQDDS
jgi:alpha-1,3/alpha-1,6-mannosyltransferase